MIFIKAYKGDGTARVNIFNICTYMENTNKKSEQYGQNFDCSEYPTIIMSNHSKGGTLFVKETVEEIDKLIAESISQFFTTIKAIS
jgi:predicted KAP-like P-loop ATPase